jgi:hypothetical protein
MAPHLERVVNEKAELDARRTSLEIFFNTDIFRGLDTAEQGRLRVQSEVMHLYSTVLGQRLRAAGVIVPGQ